MEMMRRPKIRGLAFAAGMAVTAAFAAPALADGNRALVYQDQVTARAYAEIGQAGFGNSASVRQGGALPEYDHRFGPAGSFVTPDGRAALDAELAMRAGDTNQNNVAVIRQDGSASVANAFQAGSGNRIEIDQRGDNLAAFAATVGDGNDIGVGQQGSDNTASVVFVGDGNQADVQQAGTGLSIGLEHIGSNSAWQINGSTITRLQ